MLPQKQYETFGNKCKNRSLTFTEDYIYIYMSVVESLQWWRDPGGREEGGGRELALVDGVEREELEAGDECELLGEEWERRRGGGWVEAEGGSELALVDVVERKELVAGVDGEDWGR